MTDWVLLHTKQVIDSVLYSVLGTVILLGTFWLVEKILPFSMTKEIADDQNVGLGIILGAFVLGISYIIGCAIRG